MRPELHQLKGGGAIDVYPTGEIDEPLASQFVVGAGDDEPFALSKPLDQGILARSLDLLMAHSEPSRIIWDRGVLQGESALRDLSGSSSGDCDHGRDNAGDATDGQQCDEGAA